MPPKRTAVTGGDDDDPSDKFTRFVKQKLSTYTRTGQACDRCKVRKIRCDGLKQGCTQCKTANTECRTTDRISQRAMPRGYVEDLENRCSELEARVKRYEELHGLLPGNGTTAYTPVGAAPENGLRQNGMYENGINGSMKSELSAIASAAQASMPDATDKMMGNVAGPASFRAGNSDTHYLGLSAGSSVLSSMKAHGVSILGIYIDLTDLDPSEPASSMIGEVHAATSYEGFLRSIFAKQRPPRPQLPSRQEMDNIFNWYTRHSYPYLPVMHLPSLQVEIDRVYHDPQHQQTSAQIVILNMIVAIYYYQTSCRLRLNVETEKLAIEGIQRSHKYYHYALTFLEDIFLHRKVEDIQGLALVLQHMRSFPKPGGAWLLARLAMTMMVEMGMHRSAKKWLSENLCQDFIELELRKRLFHVILSVEVSLASKLGRPFSLRSTDYDTELPERIDDEYITSQGILTRPQGVENTCKFDVGIELFKMVPMYIDVSQTLYGIHRPTSDRYVSIVEEFDRKLDAWAKNFPKHLQLDPSGDIQLSGQYDPQSISRFQAVHLALWMHECRILIHHPSLGLSPSPSFNNSSLKVCVASSRQIINLTDQLRTQTDHLDTTWYSTTVQFLAILTVLFSLRRNDVTITDEEVDAVRRDMERSIDMMKDVGRILGSGANLSSLVQQLATSTFNEVESRRGGKLPRPTNGGSGQQYPPQPQQPLTYVTSPPPTTIPPRDNRSYTQPPLPQTYAASTAPHYPVTYISDPPSYDTPIFPQHPVPHPPPPQQQPQPPQQHFSYPPSTDPWPRYQSDEDWRTFGAHLGTQLNVDTSDPGIATALMNLSHNAEEGGQRGMVSRSPVNATHMGQQATGGVGGQGMGHLNVGVGVSVPVSAPEQAWTIQTNAFGYPEPVPAGQGGGGN